MDGKRTIEMMNMIIPAFLGGYLKEKREIDLIEKAKAYSEIKIATNVNVGSGKR